MPEPKDHRLIGINGENEHLESVHIDYLVIEEGTELTLVFRTDNAFRYGRLVRGDKTISERVELE